MSGPFKFVYMVLWFGIGLGMMGTLKECTMTLAGKAQSAQSQQLSFKDWSRRLQGGK